MAVAAAILLDLTVEDGDEFLDGHFPRQRHGGVVDAAAAAIAAGYAHVGRQRVQKPLRVIAVAVAVVAVAAVIVRAREGIEEAFRV